MSLAPACRLQLDYVSECIRKDISEFPVFGFDRFLKSQSPQELRRCNTLLGPIEVGEGKVETYEGQGTLLFFCPYLFF